MVHLPTLCRQEPIDRLIYFFVQFQNVPLLYLAEVTRPTDGRDCGQFGFLLCRCHLFVVLEALQWRFSLQFRYLSHPTHLEVLQNAVRITGLNAEDFAGEVNREANVDGAFQLESVFEGNFSPNTPLHLRSPIHTVSAWLQLGNWRYDLQMLVR